MYFKTDSITPEKLKTKAVKENTNKRTKFWQLNACLIAGLDLMQF